jgi:hypothetical protein
LAYDWALTLSIAVPENWNKDEMAGLDWFKNFMKRNSELSTRTPENTRKQERLDLILQLSSSFLNT